MTWSSLPARSPTIDELLQLVEALADDPDPWRSVLAVRRTGAITGRATATSTSMCGCCPGFARVMPAGTITTSCRVRCAWLMER
jgi:hypothetical protein